MEDSSTIVVERSLMKIARTYFKGDMVKINSCPLKDKIGMILSDAFATDTYCKVLVDEKIQIVHVSTCSLCLEPAT